MGLPRDLPACRIGVKPLGAACFDPYHEPAIGMGGNKNAIIVKIHFFGDLPGDTPDAVKIPQP